MAQEATKRQQNRERVRALQRLMAVDDSPSLTVGEELDRAHVTSWFPGTHLSILDKPSSKGGKIIGNTRLQALGRKGGKAQVLVDMLNKGDASSVALSQYSTTRQALLKQLKKADVFFNPAGGRRGVASRVRLFERLLGRKASVLDGSRNLWKLVVPLLLTLLAPAGNKREAEEDD